MNLENNKDIELVDVQCRLCPIKLGPQSRGIWYNSYAICEACAQNIWAMMQTKFKVSNR